MKKVGDYIIYRRDVCKITGIKNINNKSSYALESFKDKSLSISIPVDSKYIRELMTKEEIKDLISRMKDIELIDEKDRKLESKYKELLSSNSHDDLVRIIKTTYTRNKNRLEHKRKVSEKDQYYFDLAENYLYSEIGVVLGMSFDETKKYILDCLDN